MRRVVVPGGGVIGVEFAVTVSLDSGEEIEGDLPLVAVGRGPNTSGADHEALGPAMDGAASSRGTPDRTPTSTGSAPSATSSPAPSHAPRGPSRARSPTPPWTRRFTHPRFTALDRAAPEEHTETKELDDALDGRDRRGGAVAGERAVEKHGLRPIVRIVTGAGAGVAPHVMGLGPVPAARKALRPAGRWTTSTLSSSTRPSPRRAWPACGVWAWTPRP
ncbi:hypothetical protein GCM10023403_50020 [Pseudonocardia benzenivorans]